MKLRILSIIAASFLMIVTACSPEQSNILVAEFNNEPVTMGEFEAAYAKNAGGFEEAKDDSLTQLKSFLDLYVNYRMKLRDAAVRGYDNNPDLVNELNDYKKRVGVSFIKEKEIVEPALKNFYDKRNVEMRVSHIMIRAGERSKEDARVIAQNVLDTLKNGGDFAALAKKYSEDQFSKDDGGDIYYITAGQIIPEFENAIYATDSGKVYPEPVETNYGYHIVKVTDKGQRTDQVHARHILIDFKDENGVIDSVKAREEAQKILDSLRAGSDFAEMAKKHSEDYGSGENGGDLGFFERRRMVKEFDEAAFELGINEISDLVKTRYGYHIIQVLEKKGMPPFEEEKAKLRKIYDKIYFKTDLANYVDSLKTQFKFTLDESGVKNVVAGLDSVAFDDYAEAAGRDNVKDIKLFSYANKDVVADSVLMFVLVNSNYKNKIINETELKNAINEYGEKLLMEEKAITLDETNSEFASLMNDYKHGIYIFKLQEEEVWNKIEIDSTGLKSFYEETKDNYKFPERAEYSAIYVTNDSLANEYYEQLASVENFDEFANKVTKRPGMRENKAYYGVKEIENDEPARVAFGLQEGTYSKPFQYKNAWYIVYLIKKMPATVKNYDEAKPEAASAYQEMLSKKLEEQYIQELKNRYEPEIYYDNLEKAFVEESAENN